MPDQAESSRDEHLDTLVASFLKQLEQAGCTYCETRTVLEKVSLKLNYSRFTFDSSTPER